MLSVANAGETLKSEAKKGLSSRREKVMQKEVLGVGSNFDTDILDKYNPLLGKKKVEALRECCRDKPLFGVLRNPFTDYFYSRKGTAWCSLFIIDKIASTPGKLDELIAGKIPMNGQPLSQVLPEAYVDWRNDRVMCYKEADFLTDEGTVLDAELRLRCKGRPVFTPDVKVEPMSRAWAKRTARVLASDDTLRTQILAGKLRFLAQPFSEVLAGSKVKDMVFEEADFCGLLSGKAYDRLRKAVLGRPVFLPDEGCEFVLAKVSSAGIRSWPAHQLNICAFILPYLAHIIISGVLPLDGRRLTDIFFYPLPVYNMPPRNGLHMFQSPERWLASYSTAWVSIRDFPERKPDWAVMVTDDMYAEFLRDQAVFPTVAGAIGDEEDAGKLFVEFEKNRANGFYNEKHYRVYEAIFYLNH